MGYPFCRECPGVTYKYYNNGKKKQLSGVSLDDKKALENIDAINSWNEFENKYKNLFNAIRAECLGKEKNENLKKKLNSLKNRISIPGSKRNDFDSKFKKLFDMADGKIRNVNTAESITAAG